MLSLIESFVLVTYPKTRTIEPVCAAFVVINFNCAVFNFLVAPFKTIVAVTTGGATFTTIEFVAATDV